MPRTPWVALSGTSTIAARPETLPGTPVCLYTGRSAHHGLQPEFFPRFQKNAVDGECVEGGGLQRRFARDQKLFFLRRSHSGPRDEREPVLSRLQRQKAGERSRE